MAKLRVLIFLSTLLIVGVIGLFVSYYARGYRFDFKALKFTPNGILVIKSEPDGASVLINGELKNATNTTLSLPPGSYDVEIKKDGFLPWYKRLTIENEIVTQATVSLFKALPSLSPVTFSGAVNPIISEDNSKIAYTIPQAINVEPALTGLWIIDVANFPLGFGRDPRRITDGNLTGATYEFSPDARQILLTTSNGIFILDTGSFTSQAQRINIASTVATIKATWQKEKKAKNDSLVRNFPPQITNVFTNRTSSLVFSPDDNMILYQASASATLPENLVKPLPGSSTQKQERTIEEGQTYVYDIKEDRNFLITDNTTMPHWMPTSRHLLLAEEGKVTVMDYDGTNRQTVYQGAYITPFAFPFSNTSKILILTSLGSESTPNLYSITIK
jgi:hypothetical protein